MKKVFLLLVLFILSCAQTDPVIVAKQHPDVKQFLAENPDAEITFATSDYVDNMCDLPPKEYHRVVLEGQDIAIAYVDEDEVVCFYKMPEPVIIDTSTPQIEPQIKNVHITAQIPKNSSRTFEISLTEENIFDGLELSFRPQCQPWKVRDLSVHFDDREIYRDTPSCEEEIILPMGDISAGNHALTFSTTYGTYNIRDVTYPDVQGASFEISTNKEDIEIASFQAHLDEKQMFFVPEKAQNIEITFETDLKGLVHMDLNNRTLYRREVITDPRLKITNYVQRQNEIIFYVVDYDVRCQDVELSLHEYRNATLFCLNEDRDELEMIFKNTGTQPIEQIDVYVRGDGFFKDSFPREIEPDEIFAERIAHGIEEVQEVIITPVIDDAHCASLRFDNIETCP